MEVSLPGQGVFQKEVGVIDISAWVEDTFVGVNGGEGKKHCQEELLFEVAPAGAWRVVPVIQEPEMQVEQGVIPLPGQDIFELAGIGVESGQVVLQQHSLPEQARRQPAKKLLDRRPIAVAVGLILNSPTHGSK